MKKLFTMILLLLVALPTLAAKVTLVCSYVDKDGDKNEREIGFDAAAKTITMYGVAYPVDQKVDGRWEPNTVGNYDECYMSNIAFGCRSTLFNSRDYEHDWSVSRTDGEYQSGLKGGKYTIKGKCAPLKQAF